MARTQFLGAPAYNIGPGAVNKSSVIKKLNLSGGEIENIARKHSVNAILKGNDSIDVQEIINSCQHERLSQNNRPKIGF